MRRVLTSALLLAVLSSCSVVAPEYRPTPTPIRTAAATSTPDIQALSFDVKPFEIRTGEGAVTKTAIYFSNPNTFRLDWFMTVRLKSIDGLSESLVRIGNEGVPPDRADPKFGNWFFPIPPGDSWTVMRYETSFKKTDVQEFKVARSIATIGEVRGIEVASQSCANDPIPRVIACSLNVVTTTTIPGFTKLHLVVIVRSSAPREVIGALQWRPEIVAVGKPWFSLAAGETLRIQMRDSYPTPTVPWEFEVFIHAYQFPTQ